MDMRYIKCNHGNMLIGIIDKLVYYGWFGQVIETPVCMLPGSTGVVIISIIIAKLAF